MLIEGIFGGGSQSNAPSQTSPSSGSTGAAKDDTTTGNNHAAAPANGNQPDTAETYTPEETDDGTYGPTPPAETSTEKPADGPVNGPVEGEVAAETDMDAAPENSASQPVDETDAAEPAPATESDGSADEITGEQPVSAGPSAPSEEESGNGTGPAAETPVAEPGHSGSASTPAASAGVRDFVTPLLANLDAINQRSTSRAVDDASAGQRRAAANVHDQMIRQMLDQMSSKGVGSSATQLFRSDDANQTQSLPARWYAEA